MLFNSWIFFLFLPLVYAAFYLLPQRLRWPMLLLASYVFYGWWQPEFLLIIAFSTLLDFYCAGRIAGTEDQRKRKRWLLLSLATNLGILFLFKYFYFFIGSSPVVQDLVQGHPKAEALIAFFGRALPVGISFYTFQTMSYTLDVYYRRALPETHLGRFALYVSYFPQLVAGPIERFSHLNTQLRKQQLFSAANLRRGLRLMLYGFFVKMVVADNLSYTVTAVFTEPAKYHWYWNNIAVLGFGFQIYADFFGYSLIAQGVAKLFGVNLMDNFKRPYLARNISAFWKRWHISLSTWFRDYVFIPLGGSRVKRIKWLRNIALVFLLSGLWHGANYTFIVWGGLHALYYVAERFWPFALRSKYLSGALTFAAVSFAWIFFRAENMEQAAEVIKACMGLNGGSGHLNTQPFVFLLLLLFGLLELGMGERRFDAWCASLHVYKRRTLYAFLLFCILALSGSAYSPFIYFRF